MKKLKLFFAHLVSLLCILYMVLLPSNQYSWMQDLEPTMEALPEDPNAEQRLLFIGILFILVIIIQGLILFKTKKGESKAVPVALNLAALGTLIYKVWAIGS